MQSVLADIAIPGMEWMLYGFGAVACLAVTILEAFILTLRKWAGGWRCLGHALVANAVSYNLGWLLLSEPPAPSIPGFDPIRDWLLMLPDGGVFTFALPLTIVVEALVLTFFRRDLEAREAWKLSALMNVASYALLYLLVTLAC